MDQYQKEYDDLFESTHEIEVYTPNLRLVQQKYHGKLLVSGRDFVFIVRYNYNSTDGSITIATVSVTDPRVPPASPFVRGTVKVWVFLL